MNNNTNIIYNIELSSNSDSDSGGSGSSSGGDNGVNNGDSGGTADSNDRGGGSCNQKKARIVTNNLFCFIGVYNNYNK